MSRLLALGLLAVFVVTASAVEPEKLPKPQFNGPYFGKMPRAWVEILKVDADRRVLTVRTKKGDEVEVPIRGDTELRFRDSWGDLTDYYPGQSVMLFVYHDADGKWSYPRAVQDEIQMMSGHKWWWTVDAVDGTAGTLELSRKENGKEFKESFRVGSDTKVWKGEKSAGIDTLKVGDVILFQTRYVNGESKRFAVELFDAKGLEVIKTTQQAKHKDRLIANGLPAIVNDIEMLTGALTVTVQWEASDVARGIKPGAKVDVVGAEKSGVRFAAPVAESKGDGARHKLLIAADPATISRLKVGDEVRVAPSKAP